MKKIKNQAGIAVIHIILAAAILVLIILISIPVYLRHKAAANEIACRFELATAKDMLSIDYLSKNGTPTPGDAKEEVTYAMNGWDDLCPGGGDTYVIENPDGEPPYTVVCGIHDEDTAQRTRLNAASALRKVKAELQKAKKAGDETPDQVTITLNSKEYTCLRVDEDQRFTRGTSLTLGYEKKKCVIFYGQNGSGSFADSTLEEGEICYFCYADKNHCANWTSKNSWSGDSYSESN